MAKGVVLQLFRLQFHTENFLSRLYVQWGFEPNKTRCIRHWHEPGDVLVLPESASDHCAVSLFLRVIGPTRRRLEWVTSSTRPTAC